MTDGRVRVLVYASAREDQPGAVEQAYHLISSRLDGTPGLLGNALMRSVTDPAAFVVVSDWESLSAFRRWEETDGHRAATAPLRPYQDGRRGSPFGIYMVTAAYGAPG
jgi:heme-degrading monooxygenase HmoA